MNKIIIAVGVIFLVIFISYFLFLEAHPCIKSHYETQYEQPIGVVVGGSKYGGGVSIPTGNLKPVQVEVCDERK